MRSSIYLLLIYGQIFFYFVCVFAESDFHHILGNLSQLYDLIQVKLIDKFLNLPGSVLLISIMYWLYQPVILCLILPFLLILFMYITIVFIHLFRLRFWLIRQFNRLLLVNEPIHVNLDSLAYLLKRFIAALWDTHGRIFNGYEIVGMEKLPFTGPSFLVYYHGTCPFDAYYFLSRYCIERDRFPIAVVDHFLFIIPGFGRILEIIGAIEGSVEQCVSHLTPYIDANGNTHEGDVLIIAPGGVREALFSNEFYKIIWERRQGFAKVSLLSKQPIYPMFTENIRETIRVVQFGKNWFRRLYEYTRLPLAIFYGYFPVKLRTYIGDPIYPKPNESPDELANRVRNAVEHLIRKHQLLPSNLFCALLQRIPIFDRWLERYKRRLS